SVARQAQHYELERLRRSDPNLGQQTSLVGRHAWIVGLVTDDEERFLFTGATKGSETKELSQVTLDHESHFELQGGIVGLEYHPLHLLFERAFDHGEQTTNA